MCDFLFTNPLFLMCGSHSTSLSAHALFTLSQPVVQHPYLMAEFAYSPSPALTNGATKEAVDKHVFSDRLILLVVPQRRFFILNGSNVVSMLT